MFTPSKITNSLLLAAALSFAGISHGQILLSDDFTVSMQVQNNPNFEIGRQTGTLASSPYTITASGGASQVQLGNSATNVGQPGGATNSNYLLLAFQGAVQNDLAIDASLADGKPLQFQFDLYHTVDAANANWVGFSLAMAGDADPTAATASFGLTTSRDQIVNLYNGGAGYFNDTDVPYVTDWTITFSDTAGTGSPFAGSGTRVVVYNGDTLVSDSSLATAFGTTDSLRLGFDVSSSTMGVDNLVVTSIPEPGTIALAAFGALGLALMIRVRQVRRAA